MNHVHIVKYGLSLLMLGLPAWAAACDARHSEEAQAGTAAPRQAPQPESALGAPAQVQAAPRERAPEDQLAAGGVAAVPGLGTGAAPAQLARARGGAVASETTLEGVVTGNSATNVATGANTIQASSFAGASGIPIVIQNTGANVLIQNATVINLQFK